MDVVTANYGDGTGSSVTILYGTGSGTFENAENYTVGTGPRTVALGDLDSDGYLDIITSNYGSGAGNTASVLLGSADGSFIDGGTIDTGAGAIFGVMGDFNSDGALDYAATNETDGNLTVSLANTEETVNIARYSMATEESTTAALAEIEGTLERLGQERGYVGAMLSRFTVALEHVSKSKLLRAEAADRIGGVDVAHEVAEMIRLQIQREAASTILEHHKLQKDLVIKLLQG